MLVDELAKCGKRLTCTLPVQLMADPVLRTIRFRLHPRLRVLQTSSSARVRVVRLAEVDVRMAAHVLADQRALHLREILPIALINIER
jgi:hypothetical protein